MNMRESGPNVYAAGGVLIFGLRRDNVWPAEENPSALKAPQKIRDARLGFQVEGAAEEIIVWNDAVIIDVPQHHFHEFLLARRKAAANGAAHDAP